MKLIDEELGHYIGKTLEDLVPIIPAGGNGVSVFVLRNKTDVTGVRVAEDFSLRLILKKHPKLCDAVVLLANDYYGQTVLRVEAEEIKSTIFEPVQKTINTTTPQTCDYCAHNAVCDHNKYGFENCGHFLPYFI